MCGIYGIVGDAGNNRLTLARALCVLNSARGDHSAGIATFGENRETKIYKRAWRPERFACAAEFEEIAGAEYRTLIGHTRFATHGQINDKNAHPFSCGATIGVHNGVVKNVQGMKEYTGKNFPVDSQYIIYCLDKFGHIGPAQGANNIAWFGKKDAADLRLIANGNPLAFAFVSERRGFIFSSDRKHLAAALSIAGLRGKIHDFPEHRAAAIFLDCAGVRIEYDDVPALSDELAARYWEKKSTKSFLDWDSFPDSWRDCDCDRDE